MKNNININRQPLTQKDIEKGKNFDALLKKFNTVTKPFYRTKFFLSSAVVTSVVVVFTWIYLLSHKALIQTNKQVATLSKIDSINTQKATEVTANDTTIHQAKSSDPIITSSTPSVLSASSKITDITTLSEIYKHFDKAPQTFILPTNKDTSITCDEGTIIKIKAHSFLDEQSGSEISGSIRLRVKEYYKLSEILLAKLSTMSDSNMLETGGMINITAYYKDKVCVLKKSNPIEINFPTTQKKDNMQLFSGAWENDYLINWSVDTGYKTSKTKYSPPDTGFLPAEERSISSMLARSEAVNKGSTVDAVNNASTQFKVTNYLYDCSMPVFDKNDPELKYGFHRTISYPKYYEQNIQPVLVSFIVYKDGHVGEARIVRSTYHTLDSAALDCVRHLPKCQQPGKKDGKQRVDVQMETAVQFISEQGNTAAKGDYNIVIQPSGSRYTIADSSVLLKQGSKGLSYYMFNTTNLGWINCDKFQDNSIAKVDYMVNCDKNADINVSMVFHRYRSIFNGYNYGGDYFSFWVPGDEGVTIVAVKYEDGEPYLAVKETKTSAFVENDLVYQPVTLTSLQTEMEKLDQ